MKKNDNIFKFLILIFIVLNDICSVYAQNDSTNKNIQKNENVSKPRAPFIRACCDGTEPKNFDGKKSQGSKIRVFGFDKNGHFSPNSLKFEQMPQSGNTAQKGSFAFLQIDF